MKSLELIPEGPYCYTYINNKFYLCPYWDKSDDLPKRDNGYCHYLDIDDYSFEGVGLLWDQCKECNIYDNI